MFTVRVLGDGELLGRPNQPDSKFTSYRDDAADLVQETFLKAFRFWD